MPEVARPRRSSRLTPYPKAAMPVGVVEPEDPAHLAVAAVPDAPSQLGKKPVRPGRGRPCWQCGQVGHWATQCPKLDVRLRAQLAEAWKAKIQKTTPNAEASRRVTFAAQQPAEQQESKADTPQEEEEESTPFSGKEASSPSDSEEGNE